MEVAKEWELQLAETDGAVIMGLEPDQPECRILIVEDEEFNWLLLQRLLEDAGFQVRVAENGVHGVEMFTKWRPHFIWMDLRMPLMDGWKCTQHIRALAGGREVKIAAATASAFESERARVLAAGFDDFILKPYVPREIFEILDRHLNLRWLSQKPQKPERVVGLEQQDLWSLPQELLQELVDAVIMLDAKCIREVIDRVKEVDAAAGNRLAQYADHFAYTAILDAAEASLERSTFRASPD